MKKTQKYKINKRFIQERNEEENEKCSKSRSSISLLLILTPEIFITAVWLCCPSKVYAQNLYHLPLTFFPWGPDSQLMQKVQPQWFPYMRPDFDSDFASGLLCLLSSLLLSDLTQAEWLSFSQRLAKEWPRHPCRVPSASNQVACRTRL